MMFAGSYLPAVAGAGDCSLATDLPDNEGRPPMEALVWGALARTLYESFDAVRYS